MNTQVKLQYVSAFMMLIFGMVLCAFGFEAEPYGEVSSSVLGIFGQCLLYAASVFGLTVYCRTYIDKKLKKE